MRLFLDDLRADERFAPWQVEQARQALRILYRDHLGIAPHQMPAKRSTAPRDQVRQPRQLDAVHGNLLKAMRDALRVRHYSPRTMEAYLGWVRRFIAFHTPASPSDLGAAHVREFLNYLAATKNVAASTQNQALNAVVFLYRDVLHRDPGDFSDSLRAKAPLRTPETLSREQIAAHAFSDGMHIRTVQELLGHARLSTTMLYTHPMNRPGKQPTSPLDPV